MKVFATIKEILLMIGSFILCLTALFNYLNYETLTTIFAHIGMGTFMLALISLAIEVATRK